MKKDKSSKKNEVKIKPIKGNFVLCELPVYEGNKIDRWIACYVRLSEIKSVMHRNDDECILNTYKDTWYICNMHARDLTDEINENLSTLKGFNNDSNERNNISGNNFRSIDL